MNGYEPIVAQALAEKRQEQNKKPYVLGIEKIKDVKKDLSYYLVGLLFYSVK